jgi:hypothetical protein
MRRLAVLSAGAVFALPFAAATAIAEAPTPTDWVRAVGRANNLNVKTATVTGFGAVCSPNCDASSVDMTLTMTVDAATQRKYKLPSKTIAKSTPFVARGDIVAADMTATAAMRKKLKRVKQLPVTTTLVVRRPLAETATKKETFIIGATGKHRFCMGTAADPLC